MGPHFSLSLSEMLPPCHSSSLPRQNRVLPLNALFFSLYNIFFFFAVKYIQLNTYHFGTSQAVPVVKNLPVNTPDVRDSDLIPGWGRSPGEGNGNPLQYSCLGNPMGRGAWQAIVHRVAENWTRLSTHVHTYSSYHFNHLQVHNLVTLTTFTMLGNYHHYLYPKVLTIPERNSVPIK